MTTPHTLTARTPGDLIAAVPCVLGFHPEDSLVMLTFSRHGRAFHARVDLPHDPVHHDELCAVLLHAALTNHVDRVAFIAYTDDPDLAAEVVGAVEIAFTMEGVPVVEVIRADGARWFPLRAGLPPAAYDGVPYDPIAHPFLAESVLAGRVTHRSRAELEATLDPDVEALARVQALLAPRAAGLEEQQRSAEARWVLTTVSRHVAEGAVLTDDALARLVAACRDIDLRDVAWSLVTREHASRHVDFWRDVLRRTPPAWAAAPAGLLAFSAWLAGQGALAWCAVDRCRAGDPDYRMADLVAGVLEAAMPPHDWTGFGPDVLPVLGRDA